MEPSRSLCLDFLMSGKISMSSSKENIGVGLIVEAPNEESAKILLLEDKLEELLAKSGLSGSACPDQRKYACVAFPEGLKFVQFNGSARELRGAGKSMIN